MRSTPFPLVLAAACLLGCESSPAPSQVPEVQRETDVDRCERNGGPFRVGPTLVAYRSNGGSIDEKQIASIPEVTSVWPFVLKQAHLEAAEALNEIDVHGVDFSSPTGTLLARNLIEGALPGAGTSGVPQVLVGYRLAVREGLHPGRPARLLTTAGSADGSVRELSVLIAGIHRVGLATQDDVAVYVGVKDAMRLFELSEPTGYSVVTATLDATERVQKKVSAILPEGVRVRDWRSLNRRTLDSMQQNLRLPDQKVVTLDANVRLLCAALGQ